MAMESPHTYSMCRFPRDFRRRMRRRRVCTEHRYRHRCLVGSTALSGAVSELKIIIVQSVSDPQILKGEGGTMYHPDIIYLKCTLQPFNNDNNSNNNTKFIKRHNAVKRLQRRWRNR